MNSIGEACNDLKRDYDACFNTWFSEHFLKGHTNDSMCAPLFKVYQECVKRAMKEQQIDFHEVDRNLLGSEEERKPPHSTSPRAFALRCAPAQIEIKPLSQ